MLNLYKKIKSGCQFPVQPEVSRKGKRHFKRESNNNDKAYSPTIIEWF